MPLSLFDRLEGAGTETVPERLARDVADLLSARRILDSSSRFGVLAFGLPALDAITRRSLDNKHRVAGYIAETLRAFEPRLRSVRVTPIDGEVEFRFRIDGLLEGDDGASVTLRVLSPLPGGGLGAEAVVLDVSPARAHPDSRSVVMR